MKLNFAYFIEICIYVSVLYTAVYNEHLVLCACR